MEKLSSQEGQEVKRVLAFLMLRQESIIIQENWAGHHSSFPYFSSRDKPRKRPHIWPNITRQFHENGLTDDSQIKILSLFSAQEQTCLFKGEQKTFFPRKV